MKIVRTDNFNRETISEGLVAENIQSVREAEIMLKALRAEVKDNDQNWYKLEEDDYDLYRWEP